MALEDKAKEVYDGLVRRLQLWERGEEQNFQSTLNASIETNLETWKNKTETAMNEKLEEFADEMDKQADNIFATKAKEVSVKVNLSLLTKKSESEDFQGWSERIGETPIPHVEEQVVVKVESPEEVIKVEGTIKKNLSGIVGQYINVLSIFLGASAILYAATIPCAMVGFFDYLLIFGCIGIGLFGVMGILDVCIVRGDIKQWDAFYERETGGPRLKSVCCYIGPPLLKLLLLLGFSAGLTYLLRSLLYDESCGESGKTAEPPVGYWTDH